MLTDIGAQCMYTKKFIGKEKSSIMEDEIAGLVDEFERSQGLRGATFARLLEFGV